MGDDVTNRSYWRLRAGAYRAGVEEAVRIVSSHLVPDPNGEVEGHLNNVLGDVIDALQEVRKVGDETFRETDYVKLGDFPLPAGCWVMAEGMNFPRYVSSKLGDDGQTAYAWLTCCPLHAESGGDGWMPARGASPGPVLTFTAVYPPRMYACGKTIADYAVSQLERQETPSADAVLDAAEIVGDVARRAAAALVEGERG